MEVLSKFANRLKSLLPTELKISDPVGATDSATFGPLLAQCHRTCPAGIQPGWDALTDSSSSATTFTSFTWQMEGIASRLPASALRLFTLQTGDKLLAAIPMELKPGGFLESAGYAVSDYLDPLVADNDAESTWAAFLSLLDQLWDRQLKAITFHNLRDSCPARQILPKLAGGLGLVVEDTVTANAARIALPPTWDAYLESLDSHERKELRRKIRKVETQANGRLDVIDAANIQPHHISTALDLIEAADESKRQWLRENVRPLLTQIGLPLVQEGRMRLSMLMLQDAPAACLIELPPRNGPLLYNSGFDPAQRQWSPGAVTFGLAIKNAIESGSPIFDLLRGDEPYKYKLGAQDSPVHRLVLHR